MSGQFPHSRLSRPDCGQSRWLPRPLEGEKRVTVWSIRPVPGDRPRRQERVEIPRSSICRRITAPCALSTFRGSRFFGRPASRPRNRRQWTYFSFQNIGRAFWEMKVRLIASKTGELADPQGRSRRPQSLRCILLQKNPKETARPRERSKETPPKIFAESGMTGSRGPCPAGRH